MNRRTDARPVVFLHGWTMRGALFDPLAARLGPGFRGLAPDLPGHGAARTPPFGLTACTERLRAVIDATGRDDVLLVGWSMGALVAWRYLREHGPDRLAGLVTVDMSPRLVNGPGWELGLLGQAGGRLAQSTREIHEDWTTAAHKIATTMFAERGGAPGFPRAQALSHVLANDPAIMAPYWDEMLRIDLRDAIARIDLPWLVAFGGRSRVYPQATSEWIAATAPRARIARFAASGHSPHLEEPEAFAAALGHFAADIAAR